MEFKPNKHNRKTIRLAGYDYSQEGVYFVTLCCQNNHVLFGEIVNGEMICNAFGDIITQEWLRTMQIRKNILLHEFVVMPNHFHGIIQIVDVAAKEVEVRKFKSPSQTIGSIVRGFKNSSIKSIKGLIQTKRLETLPFSDSYSLPISLIRGLDYKFWQRNYYETIIRDTQGYVAISNYILTNPMRWDRDEYYQ